MVPRRAAVYLCTSAQAEFFRATATKGPPPEPEPDPLAEVVRKAAEMRRLMEAAERAKDSVYGPDGKVHIGDRRGRVRSVSLPEFGKRMARHTETDVELAMTNLQMTPAVRALAGLGKPLGPNRAARRAAAAQARRGT
ncbi:hypothetical protein [Methylobacterium indicum]|uniref:Terminase n=1 Tax=Methylobacterium indicum TaxID=1775910 RepID=A0A8H9C4D4_9HYPH|nr:hypothetical protein [Methylobacterium indicum]BCM83552.1 hypothetical protein mvi_20130 [Methylobacterium indicum]